MGQLATVQSWTVEPQGAGTSLRRGSPLSKHTDPQRLLVRAQPLRIPVPVDATAVALSTAVAAEPTGPRVGRDRAGAYRRLAAGNGDPSPERGAGSDRAPPGLLTWLATAGAATALAHHRTGTSGLAHVQRWTCRDPDWHPGPPTVLNMRCARATVRKSQNQNNLPLHVRH